MSRPIKKFFDQHDITTRLLQKVLKTPAPGSRLFPSKTEKNDKDSQLRLDAGERINGKQNIVLQVNSQATSPALKAWVNSQPQKTHAKLATAAFDTTTKDTEAEVWRVLDELESTARERVG